MTTPRTFTVWTYYTPDGRRPTLSRISAYTRWCPDTWPGGKVYEVEAASGDEAKRIARGLRLADVIASPKPTTPAATHLSGCRGRHGIASDHYRRATAAAEMAHSRCAPVPVSETASARVWRCTECGGEAQWGKGWRARMQIECPKCGHEVVDVVLCSDDCQAAHEAKSAPTKPGGRP